MLELDKKLIKKNFQKSLNTYEQNAFVQLGMAKTLINLVKESKKNFNDILEIGSYSGILTKEFLGNYKDFNSYLALDLVNSFSYIENLDKRINFIQADFEEFIPKKNFDLIVSNAALQWAQDFPFIIKKFYSFLNKNGLLAISTFSDKNMFEIKDIFDVGLKYYSVNELKEFFPKAQILEDIITLQFEKSIDILKHLKYSGVNSIVENKLNYKEIKNKLSLLEKKYQNKVTYKPLYIVIKKESL